MQKFLTTILAMDIRNIGVNAGKVWAALNENGKMTESKLKKDTELSSAELAAAIGWLAREGKVQTETAERCGKTCEYIALI